MINIFLLIANLLKKIVWICFVSRISFFKTLYFNFKMLPFSQAIVLPVFIYKHWKFGELKGKIQIIGKVKNGMINIGVINEGYFPPNTNGILRLLSGSCLCFDGICTITNGSQIFVANGGTLILNDKSLIGYGARIICFHNIIIGKRSAITWECQVTDYNSHYIEDLTTGQISTIIKPVYIGNYNWIGNRTSIMPGTKLPDRIIVASNSLLNKDYDAAGVECYSLLAGIPAKVIKKGVKRIYLRENETKLSKYFSETDKKSVASDVFLIDE